MSVTRSLPSISADDDARWRAVLRRDRRADGKFFFGVATTGVYCRASCSARRPHRKHVTFFGTAADAEKAGFRACRRCHPNGPSLTQRQAALVATACRRIETAEEVPDLDTLAKSAGLSRFHFHRLFKTATGMTPKAYATAHRSERMRAELGRRKTVTEAIYEAGFNSNGRFYANSSGILGMEAKDYRNGGTGATIRFAVSKCSLGSILVAASERGVCAIFLGDDAGELKRDLAKRFPKARLIGGDKDFEQLVAKVIRFVEAPRTGLDCRSISAAPFFSVESGMLFERSQSARSPVIRKLPSASARRWRFAPSHGQLLPTGWPLSFHAIVSFVETGAFPAIAGASSASFPC